MSRKITGFAWRVMMCSFAGLSLAIPTAAQDHTLVNNPDGTVTVFSSVSAIREVAAGKPMAGLHIDIKADGKTLDVYLSPVAFYNTYGVKLVKGDEISIVGALSKVGDTEVILAREISTGTLNNRTGKFRANMTVYLRNCDGPLWNDDVKPASKAIPAF